MYEEILRKKEGVMTDTGAIMVDTSSFTGRAPKDKYIVKDKKTASTVWWGSINQPIEPGIFDEIYDEMIKYLYAKELYVRDGYAGADPKFKNENTVCEYAGMANSLYNMSFDQQMKN